MELLQSNCLKKGSIHLLFPQGGWAESNLLVLHFGRKERIWLLVESEKYKCEKMERREMAKVKKIANDENNLKELSYLFMYIVILNWEESHYVVNA